MNVQPLPKLRLPTPHITKTQPFGVPALERLFCEADQMRGTTTQSLLGKRVAMVFYQPSTRTRFSFEAATLALGGSIISTEDAAKLSSAAKGESLEDSIQVYGHYAHCIVLRHHEDNAAERAAAVSRVPVINAGCGKGQHPTQALLDAYTIWRTFGKLDGLRVAIMGDLKFGRVVRSLAYLLGKFPNVHLMFVAPEGLELGQDMRMHFQEKNVKFTEYRSVDEIIDIVDVLYVTRVQLEYMHEEERIKFAGSYRLHRGQAQRMREKSIIMHPLPRVDEISTDVDSLPQAVYLSEQVENGLYIRMALLKILLAQ